MKKVAAGLLYLALLSPGMTQPLSLTRVILFSENINGLQVNSTLTDNGMIFYQSFLNFWREKSGNEKFNIEIAERSSKRRGSQISISSGQKIIFFGALPIQRDRIRLLSEQAADTCYANLITLSLPFAEPKDVDVAEDEM